MTFNAAAFWTEVSDYQTAITQINAIGPAVQYISNIPKVRSRGVEGDLSYAPSERISLTASASYIAATYCRYSNAPQAPENNATLAPTEDLTGVQLAGVPKFTYTLGADIAQPIYGGAAQLYAHDDFSHRSSFNTSSR